LDIIELLRELVSINTVNNPAKNIKPDPEAAKFIRDHLIDWGLEPELLESNGYYSVYGHIGEGKPYVMLLAHYDVVPVALEKWSYDPFKLTIVNDKAFGRGSLDDKSNVVALMIVLRELAKHPPKCRVIYAFTGDEETGGVHGAKIIAEKLLQEDSLPKYLINADGHGMKIITRRRKVFNFTVEVPSLTKKLRGQVKTIEFSPHYPVVQHSHAAYFVPGADIHPLIAASIFVREKDVYVKKIDGVFMKSNVIPSKIILEYVIPDENAELVEYDENLTQLLKAVMPLTRITIPNEKFSEFGVNITPNMYMHDGKKHSIKFDVRAMVLKPGIIEEKLKEALTEVLPQAKYSVLDGGGGYMYTPRDSILVQGFEKALESVGEVLRVSEGAGASDSRHFTQYGVEAVDFGPHGGNIHGDNEYVVVSSLKKLPTIYLTVIKHIESLSR